MKYDLAVIGGGAAGFYGAVHAASLRRGLRVLILEKSPKLLSKVKISGGGRCNVTHDCETPAELSGHYPRGEKFLKQLFRKHAAEDTVSWFLSKGVRLKVEEDGRMFPTTDDSQTIINCFLEEARKLAIEIVLRTEVTALQPKDKGFQIITSGEVYEASAVLVCIGGHPSSQAYDFLRQLGLQISKPIPSLFTFNDSSRSFADLMGIAVSDASVRIAGTKYLQRGPVLITHWGLSGPAVIRLSAWAATDLHARNYQFDIQVNWAGDLTEDACRAILLQSKSERGKQKIINHPLFHLPQRLWVRLITLAGLEERTWAEAPQKNLNKLMESLIRCPFSIRGKTTFKDEFVTAGGVDLVEIDPETMESRKFKGLYFAGEVLNIDGETGGFNFQAAWSTSWVAATSIAAAR